MKIISLIFKGIPSEHTSKTPHTTWGFGQRPTLLKRLTTAPHPPMDAKYGKPYLASNIT